MTEQGAVYKGYTGTVELGENTLTIRREGLRAKAGKLETHEIPLAALSGVNLKAATLMKNGHLQLEVGDEPGYPSNPTDPYTVVFTHGQRAAFTDLAERLHELIAHNRDAGIDPASVQYERLVGAMEELKERKDQRQGERRAKVASAGTSFAGITLKGSYVSSSQGGGPVEGARATVDTAGQLSRRITATRLVLTGPLALAWRKKKDERELYLLVEGDGWAISVPVDPKKGAQARSFAARINAAASRNTARDTESAKSPVPEAAASTPAAAQPAASDPLEQLRKLGELRDAGIITIEEFEAKKAELLDRL